MATDAIIVGICYFQGKMAHTLIYYRGLTPKIA